MSIHVGYWVHLDTLTHLQGVHDQRKFDLSCLLTDCCAIVVSNFCAPESQGTDHSKSLAVFTCSGVMAAARTTYPSSWRCLRQAGTSLKANRYGAWPNSGKFIRVFIHEILVQAAPFYQWSWMPKNVSIAICSAWQPAVLTKLLNLSHSSRGLTPSESFGSSRVLRRSEVRSLLCHIRSGLKCIQHTSAIFSST